MKMLGNYTQVCPHGRHCTDNPAPGKERKATRRTQKRREQQAVARDIRRDLTRD
jgi:hypothetical protein